MDKLKIQGGTRLEGIVPIQGAKNAALPAMAATLLTGEPVELQNLPLVNDIQTTRKLLEELGVDVEVSSDRSATLSAAALDSCEARYELVKTMRASVLVLGPLLARFGRARVSLPGGCAIGARPIDLHIRGFRKLGAEVRTDHGYVEAVADRLRGADILFDRITVTGTENLMMAATLADGTTTLRNAACEPEVSDLALLLNRMGARVEGAGTSTITIQGVSRLNGTSHRVIPDRIEAGTFLIAGVITEGNLEAAGSRSNFAFQHHRKTERSWSRDQDGWACHPCLRRFRSEGRGCDDEGIPWICDRHAGAVHGPHDAGFGNISHYGANL